MSPLGRRNIKIVDQLFPRISSPTADPFTSRVGYLTLSTDVKYGDSRFCTSQGDQKMRYNQELNEVEFFVCSTGSRQQCEAVVSSKFLHFVPAGAAGDVLLFLDCHRPVVVVVVVAR
jgi:hypothetical protein